MNLNSQFKMVLLGIFIIVVGIASFSQILLSQTPQGQILSGMVFIFFIMISIFLVKHSMRGSYNLEVEVKKMTQELESNKDKLKNKISELKNDEKRLEQELAHMEQWYDVTVKRELEMIELKKKIKEREDK